MKELGFTNEIGPNAVFNGYTDAQASEKKILRNVFEEVMLGLTLGI